MLDTENEGKDSNGVNLLDVHAHKINETGEV